MKKWVAYLLALVVVAAGVFFAAKDHYERKAEARV